jgi:hypothetical protein
MNRIVCREVVMCRYILERAKHSWMKILVMCRYIPERAKHSWMKILVMCRYIQARMLTLVPRYRFANAPTVKVGVRVTSAIGNYDYSMYVIGHDDKSIQFN